MDTLDDEAREAKSIQVPAITSTKAILDFVSSQPTAVGVSEIAKNLGLPKSSVHRLCRALADLDILTTAAGSTFKLGPSVLAWASAFTAQNSLVVEFHNLAIDTTKIGGGALNLSIMSGDEVVYISCRQGDSPLGMNFRVGMSLPAVYTATGKAMMSTWDEASVEQLAERWPAPYTKHSVAGLDALKSEITAIRGRGYSIEDGQLREGMLCIGVPIFGPEPRRAIAGLAVGLLNAEAKGRIDEYGRELVKIGVALSGRMGASFRI